MVCRGVSITKTIALGASVKTVYQSQVCILMYLKQLRIKVTRILVTTVYRVVHIMCNV